VRFDEEMDQTTENTLERLMSSAIDKPVFFH